MNKMEIKKIRGIRAQGHIEMILSMVLFIGALIFIFIFINPFSKITDNISIIDDVEDIIIENISMNIGKLSAVEDVNGVDCSTIGTNYGINYIEVQNPDKVKKVDFYFANFFSSGGCSEPRYTLGAFTNETIIINESIGKLKIAYDADYLLLKNSLGLSNDFTFIVKDNNGVEVAGLSPGMRAIPAGVDVESKEIPIKALRLDGTFEELILNIRAW